MHSAILLLLAARLTIANFQHVLFVFVETLLVSSSANVPVLTTVGVGNADVIDERSRQTNMPRIRPKTRDSRFERRQVLPLLTFSELPKRSLIKPEAERFVIFRCRSAF